jgi:drug/metabolite transporter (DMT)-like permease
MAYIRSYKYLNGYQVAVFTIFTPIFVTLIYDGIRKKFHAIHLLAAILAVTGSAYMMLPLQNINAALPGILLIQAANLCFAFGQVGYKTLCRAEQSNQNSVMNDVGSFGYMYLGAVLVTAIFSGINTDWSSFSLSHTQIAVLLYLGLLPSGLAFFLWNCGAKRVNAGTLAAFNNLKIPLGVLASLIIFKEHADIPRLLIGGSVITLSIIIAKLTKKQLSPQQN